MEILKLYSVGELVALLISVLIGTGAYIGFIILNKNKKANVKLVFLILIINYQIILLLKMINNEYTF